MSKARSTAGLTTARIRDYHHRLILQRLRRLGAAARADLAREAQLSNPAIGQIVDDLERLGLISAIGRRREGGRGQPAIMLSLKADGAFGLGVRLDRTRIEVALVDLLGTVLSSRSVTGPLPAPDRALPEICRHLADLTAEADRLSPGRVAGIGLARPFDLGAWLDRLSLDNPDLALWDGVDVASRLAEATGLPVHEENDGTCAAIGELFHGFGLSSPDFLYFFIGPVIGGGVILEGDYRRGIGGNAGDVAVTPVMPSRLPSAPPARGRYDPLLSRASLYALMRHLRWHGQAVQDVEALPAAIQACPAGFAEWRDDCVEALAAPMLSAQALLEVSDVVLDGDLPQSVLADMAERLSRLLAEATPEARIAPRLRLGSFGSSAHVRGAASLPLFIDLAPRSLARRSLAAPAEAASALPLRGGTRNPGPERRSASGSSNTGGSTAVAASWTKSSVASTAASQAASREE